MDELLEYYQSEGVRHLRCALTIPLRGIPLPAFAQRRGPTTPLHQAATEGQRDAISSILGDPNHPDIHSKNEEGLKLKMTLGQHNTSLAFIFLFKRKHTATSSLFFWTR